MKLDTDGIVLRDYKIEDDRILTLLTKKYGIITAYAGGANRIKSTLAGSTELLCYSDFILFRNRDRYSVDGADLIRGFFGLRGDFENLALASYFAELTSELATHRADAENYMRLLLNTLHFLEKGGRERDVLKPLFELRSLTLSGYMPNLIACGECGEYIAEEMSFFPADGGLICGKCLESKSVTGGDKLPSGVLEAMRHIIYSDIKKLFSFTLPDGGLKRLGMVSERYLKYQLEKTFPTLEFYNSLQTSL